MAQTSVAQFASELKVPPSVLIEQLRAAGVEKRLAEDSLTEQDKARLLEYLRKSHGTVEPKNKITLMRKQTSEIKKSDSMGKARTIQVEVRKKRVFVKRDPSELAAAATAAEMPAPPPPPPPPAAVAPPPAPARPAGGLGAKEMQLREDEYKRQQQLSDIQANELREKQERERRESDQKAAERAAPPAVAAAPGRPPTARCTRRRPATPRRTRRRRRSSRPPSCGMIRSAGAPSRPAATWAAA